VSEKDEEWELILEEYKSLRQEQLNKMDKQYQITGIGIGGVATLLAAAYEELIYPLFLILPLVIIAFMALYEAESGAIIRAGEYIKILETDILKKHSELGWERWLATEHKDKTCIGNKPKTRIYNLIDHSSRCVLFLLYMGCILGIITFPEQKSDFIFLGGDIFRYILTSLYILIGAGIFLVYTLEQKNKRKALTK
jgi:hypothetical protein